jgi:geranylgeranylglycerol-phosphate geranylgeranyltransferase
MKTIIPYFKIIRPYNALMAAAAVTLGFWLSGNRLPFFSLVEMLIAAICAVGYGNVLNDIVDVASDRINHPRRPLPKNEMSLVSAIMFLFFLCSFSFVNAFLVSTMHLIGVAVPLALLSLYAYFLKRTPFAGNIIVSLLVAYPLLFGGIAAPRCQRLFMPALFAFLLNFVREIVKAIQDKPGDAAVAVKTTALLPTSLLKSIMLGVSVIYLPLLFIPYLLKQFGFLYLIACIFVMLPLHGYWTFFMLQYEWDKFLERISLTLKIEMLVGLLALAADEGYFLLH